MEIFKNKFENMTVEVELSEVNAWAPATIPQQFKYITNIKSNMPEFISGPIRTNTKIQVKTVNSFYWLMTDACKNSKERLLKHGYSLEDVIDLQESICAIYRHNWHDKHKIFFNYLKKYDENFVLNDCMNCALSKKENCKMYIRELDAPQR